MDRTPGIQQAWRFFHANQLQQAADICQQMLASNPEDSDALILSGMIANRGGRWEAAVNSFRRAIRVRSGAVEAHVGLGVAYFGMRRLAEAEGSLAEALRLNPVDFDANQNMGILRRELGRLEAAAEHFRRALEINPASPTVRVYLAAVLRELGRLEESDRELWGVLRLAPGLAEAHMQVAWNHLLQGRFREGWAEYEWRWRCAGMALPRLAQPVWDGSDVRGRRIMLHAEQGYGDTLQFIRYARVLADRGARVVLYCQEAIRELVVTAPGIDQVVSDARGLGAFDVWCPLMSLPGRLGTTLETVPGAVPYLFADERRVAEWGERLRRDPVGFRVGLCWAGSRTNPNHARRSIPVEGLSALGRVAGVVIYSLQVDGGGGAVASIPMVDHTPAIRNFSDTAALVAQLDLVISVDTAAAHLAGALGKKVWTLLPEVAEWRWLMKRADSPWYPTMRLMRKENHSWGGLVESVAEELRKEVGGE